MDAHGEVLMRAPPFVEGTYLTAFVRDAHGEVTPQAGEIAPELSDEASVYGALILGVRDYVRKHGFPGVVVGLSGGIDSALTLAIAVDALGRECVQAVMMPSRYTSDMSLADAREQAGILGVNYSVLSIEGMFEATLATLKGEFAGRAPDATEENIQSRCRMLLLMGLSNKTGRMLLTTGNKSEMAVGYATLYGDMAGGFAPIKDCSKVLVYRLANYRNSLGRVIPQRVIERAPSAELRPGQKDSDSLPPYEVLDPILEALIEEDLSVDEIEARGRRALDHPLRNRAAEGVPVAREAVHQELAAVLDRREAAGHVAVERRIAHGHLALVAGGEEHPPGLVRDPHEQQHAAAGLDVLLRGVLRATRELALERRERALEHSLYGQHAALHAEHPGLLLCILEAHGRGIARRHHHRLHAVLAEGIHRDREREGGIDAAREPH